MPDARTARTSVHRVVLVPMGPISPPARGERLVRRYRLARVRLPSPILDPRAVDSSA